MKLEVELPAGTLFHGLFRRGTGWGAILACTPGFWPSRYAETFADMRPKGDPKYHSCSAGSDGCASAQAAIDTAYEKLILTMERLDGITRYVEPKPNAQTAKAVGGIDLGSLDL